MARIDTYEMTKWESANIVCLLNLLTRSITRSNDERLWLDEVETKEVKSRVNAAWKTMLQEDPDE